MNRTFAYFWVLIAAILNATGWSDTQTVFVVLLVGVISAILALKDD